MSIQTLPMTAVDYTKQGDSYKASGNYESAKDSYVKGAFAGSALASYKLGSLYESKVFNLGNELSNILAKSWYNGVFRPERNATETLKEKAANSWHRVDADDMRIEEEKKQVKIASRTPSPISPSSDLDMTPSPKSIASTDSSPKSIPSDKPSSFQNLVAKMKTVLLLPKGDPLQQAYINSSKA